MAGLLSYQTIPIFCKLKDDEYSNKSKETKKFKVILNAHLDVVTGSQQQFQPIEKNGRIYGRGAYDMKAAAVVMILLFKEIATKVDYPLALELVSDEEDTSEYGTQYHIKQGLRGDFVICGEGSNLRIIPKSKGIMTLKLTTDGKAAHSGYPWLGDNAITKMHEALALLLKTYPTPKEEAYNTIVHITGITSRNENYNKIPVDCTAYIDVRFIAEDADTILQNIQSLLPSYIHLEILCNYPANDTSIHNPYIKHLQESGHKVIKKSLKLDAAHAASDMAFFKTVGCDGVEFGPSGGGHHSDNEWVDIQSLEDYYHILKNFLLSVKNL